MKNMLFNTAFLFIVSTMLMGSIFNAINGTGKTPSISLVVSLMIYGLTIIFLIERKRK